jgi:hypothetical protein
LGIDALDPSLLDGLRTRASAFAGSYKETTERQETLYWMRQRQQEKFESSRDNETNLQFKRKKIEAESNSLIKLFKTDG